MRAVIDTNDWVSALVNPAGAPARVLAALREGRFELVASEALLSELATVLVRPRLARRFGITPAKAADLLDVLREQSKLAQATGSIKMCRDPRDDVVIETAISGSADALASRDDDLKGSAEIAAALAERGVSVLIVQRFLDALSEEAPAH